MKRFYAILFALTLAACETAPADTRVEDCSPGYSDNSYNPANLNHPAFGCATHHNMVHMVPGSQQWKNPAKLGASSGEKAAQNYDRFLAPPAAQDSQDAGKKLIGSETSQ